MSLFRMLTSYFHDKLCPLVKMEEFLSFYGQNFFFFLACNIYTLPSLAEWRVVWDMTGQTSQAQDENSQQMLSFWGLLMDKWTMCHGQVAVKNCPCYACRQSRYLWNSKQWNSLQAYYFFFFDNLSTLVEGTIVCIKIFFFLLHDQVHSLCIWTVCYWLAVINQSDWFLHHLYPVKLRL